MRKLIIFLLLACLANAEEWRFGRSVLSDGKRMEMFRTAGKIPSSLYPYLDLWTEFNYDDSTVVLDLSGNNKTGTITAATWESEATGGVLNFNGINAFVNYATFTPLNNISNFTVACWVFLTATPSGNNRPLWSHELTGVYQTGLYDSGEYAGSDDIIFSISAGSAAHGYTKGNILTTGTWHHATLVFNGAGAVNATRAIYYHNGVQQTITFAGAAIPTKTHNQSVALCLARNRTAGSNFGKFKISNLIVLAGNGTAFNMTSNQVYNLYLRGR